MRSQLELLTRFLIDVRLTEHSKYFFLCGQRNRASYDGTTIANSFYNFLRRFIYEIMVVGTKFDSNLLIHAFLKLVYVKKFKLSGTFTRMPITLLLFSQRD